MEMVDKLKIPVQYKQFLNTLINAMHDDKRIEQVLLFGSCARGTLRAGSDIDVAVITREDLSNEDELSFYDYLLDIDPQTYVSCDLLVMSKNQFEKHKEIDGYVQKYIFKDGVDLFEPVRTSM